jgi:large-conductance mechanosensitive channel
VGLVVDKVVMGQAFSQILRFPVANIIPPLLNIHSHIMQRIDSGSIRGPVSHRNTVGSPYRENNSNSKSTFTSRHENTKLNRLTQLFHVV